MILQLHPTGNANVRQVLRSLIEAGQLGAFATTLGFAEPSAWQAHLPDRLRRELGRRNFAVPRDRLFTHPTRETLRLIAVRLGWLRLAQYNRGCLSEIKMYTDFDAHFAGRLPGFRGRFGLRAVYAYEDGAESVFTAARSLGLSTFYELPIVYWETLVKLLTEEAERWPAWRPTFGGIQDSPELRARKQREIELADTVICPSRFVLDSIPPELRAGRRCVLAPYGGPVMAPDVRMERNPRGARLRVLFAGALSQRKGLADVFAAWRMLKRSDIELVVLGRLLAPLEFYTRQCPGFIYEAPRPHADVLALMQTCDVFLFPSIAEGRALVQQEAMACGLPLIATPNAGGDDLIVEGTTGFLVPIRQPEAVARRLDWCADHREGVREMGDQARLHAAAFSWEAFRKSIAAITSDVPNPSQ